MAMLMIFRNPCSTDRRDVNQQVPINLLRIKSLYGVRGIYVNINLFVFLRRLVVGSGD